MCGNLGWCNSIGISMPSILHTPLAAKIENCGAVSRHHPSQNKMSTQTETQEEILCAHCHQEPPMYPCKDSEEDCHILCVDCFWEADAERKRKKRQYWKENPEAFEAFRKHAAEVLGVKYTPLNPAQSESK